MLPRISHECVNLRSATHNFNDCVTELIQTEVDKGFLSGPYVSPPTKPYRVNPIGVAQGKYSLKKRLIVDLSSPHDSEIVSSLNDLLRKEEYCLSYVRIDDAIDLIQTFGPGTKLCKTDISDAFKQLPLHPSLWPFHGFKWNSQYYFYTRLVFGSRASPKLFESFAASIEWILVNRFNLDHVLHLLDDFLLVTPPNSNAHTAMDTFIDVLAQLDVPLSPSKTEGPVTSLQYLGIILDTDKMEARLPMDKLARINQKLDSLLQRRSCTKQELLSLLGHLNFAARVIYPGRSFISRIIELSKAVKHLHHYIYISRECRLDLSMWKTLLARWNGISLFLDPQETVSDDMKLFTDASGIGFGGIFGTQWFQGHWPNDLRLDYKEQQDMGKLSIAFQELYPIVVAALIWGRNWARKRILFKCDDLATVYAICKGRSKSPAIMKLMRRLVLVATEFNFMYSAEHVPGSKNIIADSLSRLQTVRFRQLAPWADQQPRPLPHSVMFA